MKKNNIVITLISVGMLMVGCKAEASKEPGATKIQNTVNSANSDGGEING